MVIAIACAMASVTCCVAVPPLLSVSCIVKLNCEIGVKDKIPSEPTRLILKTLGMAPEIMLHE